MRIAGITALLSFVSLTVAAQDLPRPLTPADYGQWERLTNGTLSPDGTWLAYGIVRVNEENELRVRPVGTDSIVTIAFGSQPSFSSDNRWLAYQIGVSQEERERLRDAKKPVRNGLGLLDLTTGQQSTIDEVQSFSFSDDGQYLAMRRYSPEDSPGHSGVNLIVRTMSTGIDLNFGNVAEYAWQDEGTLLAMIIDAEGQAGNGVQVFNPSDGTMRMFEAQAARYRGLSWREESTDFAVLRVEPDSMFEDSTHTILAWTRADRGPAARNELPFSDAPAGMRIVEHRDLEWSDDGASVFFGIQSRIPTPENADSTIDDDDRPTVEIWHARDVDIIPTQKVRRQRMAEENYLAVWHLNTNAVVQLGTELTETVTRVHGDQFALGMDRTPYDQARMFGPVYRNVYLIDTRTGEPTAVHDQVEFDFGVSPAGKYYLFFKDDHYWAFDIEAQQLRNITANVAATFTNFENNHTVPQKPPYRIAGWTEDDDRVLIYDKHDIWSVRPDGAGGERLTNGVTNDTRYRYARVDPDQDVVDLEGGIYLTMYNEWTEEWGYASLRRGGAPRTLAWDDARVGRITKARDADVVAFVREDVNDSPDYFVADGELEGERQVSATNPFHGDYALSNRVDLLNYENTWGAPLQGALMYPADYDSTRTYPMIVYIYEIVSPAARSYTVPSERSAYNAAVWSANGYFVYRPDITYRDRNPGLSAVEALEPAVARALETGMIDPDRVGLVGHSWGGYQTAFALTQTDIFAAGIAGAPLTNLTSMYLSVYWNSGGTDARIFEISQGRMEVPFWEDTESYLANSPVFHVDKLNTPLLLAHGTEDGAVDYNQGVEYYNAARRAGKDFVMLVYNGENHGNRQKPNQIDYHNRIMQWFGHYLKGEPAPEWIVNGLPYETQQRMLKYGPRARKVLIP